MIKEKINNNGPLLFDLKKTPTITETVSKTIKCWMICVVCYSGVYGNNWVKQCSINCNMIWSCDRVTGECDRGCKP